MKHVAVLAVTCVLSLAAAAAEPEGPQRVLVLSPGAGNSRNSEGDFIQLNDGRLLFVYTHFTESGSDHGAAFLAGRVSTDRGKTWSGEDTVILPNEGGMNVMSVSLLRLQTGEIALFYLLQNSTATCARSWQSRTTSKTGASPCCASTRRYFVVKTTA